MHVRRLFHRVPGRGQALVEFALVLPIFAIMLFGIIDLGRYVFIVNSLNNGAREAARFASVVNRPPECAGLSRSACATAIAKSHVWGVPGSSVTVKVECRHWPVGATSPTKPSVATCTTDDFLWVQTKTVFTLVTPLIGQLLGNQTITGETQVVVNQ